jgi:hypothetical protein
LSIPPSTSGDINMRRKFKPSSLTLPRLYQIFLGLAILEGFIALLFLFRVPSEAKIAFLAGYSLRRLGIGFAISLVLTGFICLLLDSFGSRKLIKSLSSKLNSLLDIDIINYLIKPSLFIVLLVSAAIILFYLFPILQRLVFFLPNNYLFAIIGQHAGPIVGWAFLISLKLLILYFASGRETRDSLSIPVRLMVLFWVVETVVFIYVALWTFIARKAAPEILSGPGVKILILSIWFSLWALLDKYTKQTKWVFHLFACVSIWLCVFLVSLQFAQWFDVWNIRPFDPFRLLANSFLHGKIYLLTTPQSTHDLTFYNGHWYVPYPPFPAILMLPLIAIWGIEVFNLTAFSLALTALAAVIVYLILIQLKQLQWIKLSRSGVVWLTALFSFGTVYWWLSILGSDSFFSQGVTVLFCAFAFLSALKKSSPWITGICLTAAVLSRPNVFVLWPALLAIAIQLNSNNHKKVNWKNVLRWGVPSAIPVVLGVGFLLSYNFLRFGNFFDFGYVTINGAKWIVQNVREFGIFNLHFLPFNLHSIFVALPPLTSECEYYLTRGWGMSIFFTTPAIVYLLRKFRLTWWICGCWCSIIFSIALLALYHNNGANQYGYRYMMDFMIPIIMLIAYNAGKEISIPLKILILTSILINYYGTISWFKGPC